MQLRHLRYFIGIIDSGSFRAASVQLGVSQPALSRRIAELEEELGVTLFDRSRSGVRVTPAGHAYASEIRVALGTIAAARRRAIAAAQCGKRQLRFGSVRSASRFACIDKGINSFARTHRDTSLHVHRLSAGEVADGLSERRLDAGITYSELLTDRSLPTIPLHVERVMLAMPREHPLAGRRHVRLADLAEVDFVWTARDSSPRVHDALMAACNAHGFRPRIAAVIDSTESLTLVRSGVGCTFVTSSTASRSDCKKIVLKPVADLTLPLTLIFTWDSSCSPANDLALIFRRYFAAHRRLLARLTPDWARPPHPSEATNAWAQQPHGSWLHAASPTAPERRVKARREGVAL